MSLKDKFGIKQKCTRGEIPCELCIYTNDPKSVECKQCFLKNSKNEYYINQ